MTSLWHPSRPALAFLLAVALVIGCGGPSATQAPAGSVVPAASSGAASGSPPASAVFAERFDQLQFRFTLPAGWTLGTPAQRDAYWQSLVERSAQIVANLAAESSIQNAPIAFVAYDGTEDDDRNPVLTCSSLTRGSTSVSEALELGQRQNVEGISRSPNLVGEPSADRLDLPLGEVVRIRWREQAPGADISSIGYLFVTGPSVVTCVFRTLTDAVAAREPEWEAILRTFESAAHWAVTATIPVGVKPFEITAGGDAVWVADFDSGELSRIDPATNVALTNDLRPGRSASLAPWDIEYINGRLWVTTLDFAQDDPIDGTLLVIDPLTGSITDEVRIGRASLGLALGFGSAWVSNSVDGTVLRVDERTLKVTASVDVGTQPNPVAVSSDAVWVADSSDGTVSRIDPATNEVKVIDVGPDLRAMAVGERGVWVSSEEALYLLDAASGATIERLEAQGIGGLVARDGTVWAAEALGVHVLEIDEASATVVESVTLATNSWGITELNGTLWVVQPAAAENKFAESKPGTVTRLDR